MRPESPLLHHVREFVPLKGGAESGLVLLVLGAEEDYPNPGPLVRSNREVASEPLEERAGRAVAVEAPHLGQRPSLPRLRIDALEVPLIIAHRKALEMFRIEGRKALPPQVAKRFGGAERKIALFEHRALHARLEQAPRERTRVAKPIIEPRIPELRHPWQARPARELPPGEVDAQRLGKREHGVEVPGTMQLEPPRRRGPGEPHVLVGDEEIVAQRT